MNNRTQKSGNSKEPHLSFRNTRSKFYKKQSEDMDAGNDQTQNHSPQMNTGNYWKEQGNSQFKKGNLSKAIEYYSKAIQKSAGQSVYFCNRSKCHKILGNIKDALKDAQDACQLDPDSIKANYICGCILAQLGKHDISKLPKAQNRFRKALRLCSTHKKTQFEDEISIKYYRLKKLIFYINLQEEIEDLIAQKNCLNTKNLRQVQANRILARIQNRISQLKNFSKVKQIPDHLCCKITLELMEEPVTTEEGLTYQKSALEDHFKTNGFIEPISRKKLTTKPYQNIALKNTIEEFLKQNPWAFEHGSEENFVQIKF